MKNLRTRYRPKRRTSAPKALPTMSESISISEAAALITERCRPEFESARSYKNKARERIKYALGAGKLKATGKLLNFGDFILWARKKTDWKSGLAGLACLPELQLEAGLRSKSKFSGTLFSAPGDLKACQAELIDAVGRIDELERELTRCKEFIFEFHPCIESGLKIKRMKHLREDVQNFVDELRELQT